MMSMNRTFFLTIIVLVLLQFLQASEKEEKNYPKMEIDGCIVEFNDQPEGSISLRQALDLCEEFVEKNKIDFNIKASTAMVWVKHSKNGITLEFNFIHKFRCLIMTISEKKKVSSWEICFVQM